MLGRLLLLELLLLLLIFAGLFKLLPLLPTGLAAFGLFAEELL